MREFQLKDSAGHDLYACEWMPAHDEPRAVVGIIHGMGEHTGRYAHVAERLTEADYAVLAFDQRGHGRTTGKRGHTPSFELLLEGVDSFVAEASRRFPGLPLFLYGHSMGGNVTLNYLLRRRPKVAGAVVTSPWLRLAFQPPMLQVVIGRMIERFYPTYTSARPQNASHLTTDPVMMETYRTDPLIHGHITARFFFGIQRAGLWAIRHAGELNVPVLLLHGGDDPVTSITASAAFADRAREYCEFKEWPGFRHELHYERGREDVFSNIVSWLDRLSDQMKRK